MNIEDYPLVEYGAMRLRRVPELPTNKPAHVPDSCTMCAGLLEPGIVDTWLCPKLRNLKPSCSVPSDAEDPRNAAGIMLREEDWEAYVVEYVSRRVS